MFRTGKPTRRDRRAMILLIVVSMLTLFAVVGLSFLLYAENTASSLRAWRESQQGGHTQVSAPNGRGNPYEEPPIPQDIFNQFLGQVIYDVDDSVGTTNPLWGNSLARAMYGWSGTAGQNTVPYNGIGRVRDAYYTNINYVGTGKTPEKTTGTYIAKNAPYTYPDENNAYLAAVRPTDGYVMVPSFHRPWNLTTSGTTPWYSTSSNVNLTLRPLSAYKVTSGTSTYTVNPNFPPPILNADNTTYGDVENLEGKLASAKQRYDSFWIDFDLPVRTWRGKLYKPLVAPLIIDLDGRINLNVAGNIKGPTGTGGSLSHASNEGWGGWEVNLGPVLTATTSTAGTTDFQNLMTTRYGADSVPTKVFEPFSGTPANQAAAPYAGIPNAQTFQQYPPYAMIDYDGSISTTTPGAGQSPALANAFPLTQYLGSPVYPSNYQNASQAELTNHPAIYNPYLVSTLKPPTATNNDRAYSPFDQFLLNGKFMTDDINYQRSGPGTAAPTNFGQSSYSTSGTPAPNPRFLTSTLSNDLDRVGMPPWQQNWNLYGYQRPAQGADPNLAAIEPGVIGPAQPPAGNPIPSPASGSPAPTTNSDFTANWGSQVAAAIGSIDLNRRLRDYWTQTPAVGQTPDAFITPAQAALALQDRQQLAKDIYTRLLYATGAKQDATQAGNPTDFEGLRYLAQLAVNIVDYIDNDDFITPFNWNGNNWVYGTELPRLVLNEAYVLWRNDPSDPGAPVDPMNPALGMKATKDYWVEIWAELFNPLTPATAQTFMLRSNGGAPLNVMVNGTPVPEYRIGVTPTYNQLIRRVDNVQGQPDGNGSFPNAGNPFPTLRPSTQNGSPAPANPSQFGAQGAVVRPSDGTGGSGKSTYQGNAGNPGFYLVGPPPDPANGKDPVPLPGAPDATVPNFQYTTPLEAMGQAAQAPTWPTIFLQRLACPYVPADPITNPYVTVDYFDTLQAAGTQPVWDHRQWNGSGPNVGKGNYKQFSAQQSFGRSQPHAGHYSRLVPQTSPANPMADAGINQTFWLVNRGTNAGNGTTAPDNAFEWLAHLDRPLVSPTEITSVSAWKPHELTQQFITGAGPFQNLQPNQKHQHLADWRSNTSFLYRALGLLQTRDGSYGMGFGGRVPGRVNINTIWDPAILQALCDYQVQQGASTSSNGFTATDVNNAWTQLLTTRQSAGAASGVQIGQNDTPFLGVAAPVVAANDPFYQKGSGVQRTVLQPGTLGGANGVFDLINSASGQKHPYLRNELLNKVFNRLTTRSNVFAIWCTIGYFEVDTTSSNAPQPPFAGQTPWLGAELGSSEGTVVRHKFFAVVDRSNLSIDTDPTANAAQQMRLQGPKPVFLSFECDDGVGTTITVPATAKSTNGGQTTLVGQYDGQRWEIGPNTRLLLDVGQNQEGVAAAVTVQSVNFIGANLGGTITLSGVKNTHARGSIMQFRPDYPGNTNTASGLPSVMIGNPGPQPSFNYNSDRYRGVVPLVVQIN